MILVFTNIKVYFVGTNMISLNELKILQTKYNFDLSKSNSGYDLSFNNLIIGVYIESTYSVTLYTKVITENESQYKFRFDTVKTIQTKNALDKIIYKLMVGMKLAQQEYKLKEIEQDFI